MDQLFNSSEKRLASGSCCCWQTSARKGGPNRSSQVSQETLAEMIGTTRSRVSFFMNKFRRMGFIDYNGAAWKFTVPCSNVVLHD